MISCIKHIDNYYVKLIIFLLYLFDTKKTYNEKYKVCYKKKPQNK